MNWDEFMINELAEIYSNDKELSFNDSGADCSVSTVFNILLRKNILPVPPEELQGQAVDIEYVSPLARSQKVGDVQAIMRTLEIVMPLSQTEPIMDYIDSDRMVQHLGDVLGVPSKVMRSTQQVQEIRQQRQQAQQQAQEQEQMMQTAQAGGQVAPLVKELNGQQ